MRKGRLLSGIAIAAAASVWTSGALAGGGGGYTLVCNSVSPTESCNIEQQQININIVFDQNINVNQYNVLDQEILNPPVSQPAVYQASQGQVVNQAPPQPYVTQPVQQQYASQPLQSEIGYRSLQKEIVNRSVQREIGYRSTQASNQYALKTNYPSETNSYYQPNRHESNYYGAQSRQTYQAETAFPVFDVKVKVEDFVEIKPSYAEPGRGQYDYSSAGEHGRGRGEDTIFIDSIVTLLGRL